MLTSLHPRQLSLLRLRAAITALILLAIMFAIDFGPLRQTVVPPGLFSGAAAALLVGWAMAVPVRRYRSWGYRMEADELHIQRGVWTRFRTIVPFGRVQHIDVAQGPIERRFGLGTLILHTAGTRSSAVALPGLAFEEAGRMRDAIRERIRQDPA